MRFDVVDLLGLGEEGVEALPRGGGVSAVLVLPDDVDLLAGVPVEALLGEVTRGLRLRSGSVVVRFVLARERGAEPDRHDQCGDPSEDHTATAAVADVGEAGETAGHTAPHPSDRRAAFDRPWRAEMPDRGDSRQMGGRPEISRGLAARARGRGGPRSRRCLDRHPRPAVDPGRARLDRRGRGAGARRVHRGPGAGAARGGRPLAARRRPAPGRGRDRAVRARLARLRAQRRARPAARSAGRAGDRRRGRTDRLLRAPRRRRRRPGSADLVRGLDLRGGDRPGAGRRADRGLRLAGDLPRPGAADRAGGARRDQRRARRAPPRCPGDGRGGCGLPASAAARDRARPALRGVDGGDLPRRAAAGRRLEHRSARSRARGQRAAGRGDRRLAHPRQLRDPSERRLRAGRGRDRLPRADPRGLGLVDRGAADPRRRRDGAGAARPGGRAAAGANAARRRPRALDPPRGDRAGARAAGADRLVQPRLDDRRRARRGHGRPARRPPGPRDQDRPRAADLRRRQHRRPARAARSALSTTPASRSTTTRPRSSTASATGSTTSSPARSAPPSGSRS